MYFPELGGSVSTGTFEKGQFVKNETKGLEEIAQTRNTASDSLLEGGDRFFSGQLSKGLSEALNSVKGSKINVIEPDSQESTLRLDKEAIRNSDGSSVLMGNGRALSKLDYTRMLLQKNGHWSLGDRFQGIMKNAGAMQRVVNQGEQPGAFQQALTFVEPFLYLALYRPIQFHTAFPVYAKGGFQEKIQFQNFEANQPFRALGDAETALDTLNVSPKQIQIENFTFGAQLSFNYIQMQQLNAQINQASSEQHFYEFYNYLRALVVYLGFDMFLKIDRSVWRGDTATNAWGVLTHPDLPKYAPPGGNAGDEVDWGPSVNGATILNSLRHMITRVRDQSQGRFVTDTLLISNKLFANVLAYRQASDTYFLRSILGWFTQLYGMGLRNIIIVPGLDGAGTGGKEVIVAYQRNPMIQFSVVPVCGFPMLPTWQSMQINFPYGYRYGGFVCTYPNSMLVADNIKIT